MRKLSVENINSLYYYEGDDLGYVKRGDKNFFKFWSPLADSLTLCIYDEYNSTNRVEYPMIKGEKGVWKCEINEDLEGKFYTFISTIDNEKNEGVDPYARGVSINGDKGAILDLEKTNPTNWKTQKYEISSFGVDAIIYEMSIRDFSINDNSGMVNKGKFLSITEENTNGKCGLKSGIAHIKELGVTHVQLMPIFDFGSIDEEKPLDGKRYNWGYDPKNYNVPEGSYSSNPFNPYSRIKELKEGILSLHKNGISVIMDVVYNHMMDEKTSGFHKLMPGYYFRYDRNSRLVNESGCGNALATENSMVRKFIVDSVKFWASEYKIDGFRFDLMGLMDVKTMNEIRSELNKINPKIITIGEGWNMHSLLREEDRAIQYHGFKLKNIGFFNDIIRDGVRGNAFYRGSLGFVNGGHGKENDIKKGIVGAIKYSNEIQSFGEFEPNQCVNYVECHDNHTLYDKLKLTENKEEKLKEMAKLSISIVLLSQGIPFLQCGQEFLRSKDGVENSYNFPDSINGVNWDKKLENLSTFEYVKGLIELRKKHSAFKMKTSLDIKKKLHFLNSPSNTIAFMAKDEGEEFLVIFNSNDNVVDLNFDSSISLDILVDKKIAGTSVLWSFSGHKIRVEGKSTLVGIVKK
ncbi:MAG: type I pullulanase [Clostridium sp.]